MVHGELAAKIAHCKEVLLSREAAGATEMMSGDVLR